MLASLILPCLLAVCDISGIFAEKEAWSETAVNFTVEHQREGFRFASDKRDIVNCLGRGQVVWHGLDVWETKLYFGDEGVKRIELSLFNRGDARGETLDYAELKELLGRIASAAEPGGKIGKVEHKKQPNGTYTYFKRFNKGETGVDLAWGTTGIKAKDSTTDFVRVTLYPKEGRKPKGATKATSGVVSKAKVKANVVKLPSGDVYIDGVPMVDQGQKGYCAAAVSERVLRYYGKDIDEHEIAQLAGTTAGGGTRTDSMKDSVRQVGSKCRLGFNEIVSMVGDFKDIEKELENYNRAAKAEKKREYSLDDFTQGRMIDVGAIYRMMAENPKTLMKARTKDFRYKKFLAGVKTQVDQGIPVIWGVTLGIYPEPEIPQAFGGHMRLIIGYNAKKHEILYTDTWGAGHELKRMPEDWAFTITHDAFFLRPL